MERIKDVDNKLARKMEFRKFRTSCGVLGRRESGKDCRAERPPHILKTEFHVSGRHVRIVGFEHGFAIDQKLLVASSMCEGEPLLSVV
jgi:hypothetical protein